MTKWFKQFEKKVEDLDVGKLKTIPTDLKKSSNVVEKNVRNRGIIEISKI